MNSPFLIKHGLLHLTKMVMKNWDNADFALTSEQKEKLKKVKTETMGSIMEIKPEVMALRKSIISGSITGTSAAELKAKVDKLASLEAKATMTHLKCIEKTKNILTKEQLLFLLVNKHKKPGMMKAKGKMMKCAAGKCGMGAK